MEDLILLAPQIQDSCKLAIPEGLKDLMSDISREVLRFQPRNLCQFITDYLAALLVTRENLSVAGHICSDIADCGCDPELSRELSDIGLPEDEVKIARNIIVKYFANEPVNEGKLLMELMKKTTIDEDLIPAALHAVRTAYVRHQANKTILYESSSDSEQDEITCAAKHTLDLYRKTDPSEETYGAIAIKIQNSYRAYGVRRQCEQKDRNVSEPHQNNVPLVDTKETIMKASQSDIEFSETASSAETLESSSPEDPELAMSASMNKNRVTTISSTSLAGSFMNLPSHKPYSAHVREVLSDLEEIPEREHAYIDYTAESPHISTTTEEKLQFIKRESSKKISFSESLPGDAQMGLEVDDDSVSKDSSREQSMETNLDNMFYHGSVTDYYGDLDTDRITENLKSNEDLDADVVDVISDDLL